MSGKFFLIVICFLLQMNIFTCVANSFEDFVRKFRICTWSELDSLQRITMKDLENSIDTVSIHDANFYIWDASETRPHADRDGSIYHSPHVRMKNGEFRGYLNYHLGMFSFDRGLIYNEKEDAYVSNSKETSKLYPLGKIELDNIVMLVLGYKFMNELAFEFSTDVYIINKSSKRFVSAFCLSGSNPANTIVYDDYRITSYESIDTMEDIITDRFVYKIASDGYLTEVSADEKEIKDFVWKTINDSDGYVNVRNYPNTNSEILYTLPTETRVLIHLIKDSNWAEIVKIKDAERIGGYIHKSRLK